MPLDEPVIIDDPADPRVDGYRALRARESRDVLWAEGPTVVERLLASGLTTRSVLLTPALLDRLRPALTVQAASGQAASGQAASGRAIDVLVAERSVIAEVVGFDLHRGAMAIAERPVLADLDAVLRDASLVVAIEGVNDPENLGAIARSARGLGADALLLDPTCADPYYRRSVRVSMGEMLHLPIARAIDWGLALERLHGAGFSVWALTPNETALTVGALEVPDRLALLVGAEGPGLRPETLARCTNVRIPMHHRVDSLNVGHAVAATLAVIDANRNRHPEPGVQRS